MFIPDPVIHRLPVYYRHLQQLHLQGVKQISSHGLADIMNLTASQIRQDINRIGAAGRQGFGYSIEELKNYIAGLLAMNQKRKMIIIGAGNIGHALAQSGSFAGESFETIAVFDNNPEKIGTAAGNYTVRSIDSLQSFLADHPVDIAVLAVPADQTQRIAENLKLFGVKGFWNFAPIDLVLGTRAAVVNVHLTDSLEVLSYQLDQLPKSE